MPVVARRFQPRSLYARSLLSKNNELHPSRVTRLCSGIAVSLAATGVLIWRATRYYPFIADDALISLRFASRFLDGLGLTWNDGERVEGYSNLLWILAASILGAMGVDLVLSLRILGVLCFCLTIAALVFSCARGPAFSIAGMVAGSLFVALAGPIAVWAVGGLEQPLVASLLALGCVMSLPLMRNLNRIEPRRALLPGLLFGLLATARPDGILFGGVAFIALFLARPFTVNTLKHALFFGLPAIIPFALQLVFRLAYYGEWVPNTAHVKLALSSGRATGGLYYLKDAALYCWPLLVFAGLALVVWLVKGRWRRAFFFFLIFLSWAGYVTLIGGDIFPGHRHAVPLIVIAALTVALGLLEVETWGWRFKAPVVTIVAVSLVPYALLQNRSTENQRAIDERWEYDGQVLGTLLKQAFGSRRPLITVDAAGSVGYYSELPAIDMYGLNDYHIARHPPSNFGQGVIGHELGDGNYVLGRKPDILVFHTGSWKPSSPGDRQVVQTMEFRQKFEPVQVEGEIPSRYRAVIWVRTDSPRIGIQRTGDSIDIPAFLFNGDPKTVARLGYPGQLVVEVNRDRPVPKRSIDLDCGAWTITASAHGVGSLRIDLTAQGGLSISGKNGRQVSIPRQGRYLLEIRPADSQSATLLRRVEVRKTAACTVEP